MRLIPPAHLLYVRYYPPSSRRRLLLLLLRHRLGPGRLLDQARSPSRLPAHPHTALPHCLRTSPTLPVLLPHCPRIALIPSQHQPLHTPTTLKPPRHHAPIAPPTLLPTPPTHPPAHTHAHAHTHTHPSHKSAACLHFFLFFSFLGRAAVEPNNEPQITATQRGISFIHPIAAVLAGRGLSSGRRG